jgi:hypothetical protein
MEGQASNDGSKRQRGIEKVWKMKKIYSSTWTCIDITLTSSVSIKMLFSG